MTTNADPRYHPCPRIHKHVNVARNEGQCRDDNGCDAPECPLAKEFGIPPFERRLRAYGSLLGLWSIAKDAHG